MSFFRIQDTRSRPTSGTSMSKQSARRPGPIASFHASLQHYGQSMLVPAMSEVVLSQQTTLSISSRDASMENLRELQRYAERLQFEATCVRLWANGTQDQIMGEQEKVQNRITGVIGELNLLRRVQPAWIQQLQSQGNQCLWSHLQAHSRHKHHAVQHLLSQ